MLSGLITEQSKDNFICCRQEREENHENLLSASKHLVWRLHAFWKRMIHSICSTRRYQSPVSAWRTIWLGSSNHKGFCDLLGGLRCGDSERTDEEQDPVHFDGSICEDRRVSCVFTGFNRDYPKQEKAISGHGMRSVRIWKLDKDAGCSGPLFRAGIWIRMTGEIPFWPVG